MAYQQRQQYPNPSSYFDGPASVPPESPRDYGRNMYLQNETRSGYHDGRQGDPYRPSQRDYQQRGQQGQAAQQQYPSAYQADQGRADRYSGPDHGRSERFDDRSHAQLNQRALDGRSGSLPGPYHQSREMSRAGGDPAGQRGGRKPPGPKGRLNAQSSPTSPVNLGWDNPFPTFPKTGSNKPNTTGDVGQPPSNRPRRRSYDSPRQPHGNLDAQLQNAGAGQQHRAGRQDPANEIPRGYQDPRQAAPGKTQAHEQAWEPSSQPRRRPPAPDHTYSQQSMGNQRSQTMPVDVANDSSQFDLPIRGTSNSSNSATNAYHPGRAMPTGPRPMRHPDARAPPNEQRSNGGNRQPQLGHEQRRHAPEEDYEGLVDSYYGDTAGDEEMPNFDAVSDSRSGRGHIDEDLYLGQASSRGNASKPLHADRGRLAADDASRSFAGQAQRSRSQPNFRQQQQAPPPGTQPTGFDFGTGVPPQAMPATNEQYRDPARDPRGPERSFSGSTARSYGQQRPPDGQVSGPGGPHEPYPPRQDRSNSGRGKPNPMPRDPYGPPFATPSHGGPMAGSLPPAGSGGRGQVLPSHPGNGQGPARTSNPDALPEHPVPVRPGLMQMNGASQPPPPAPVRQYNNGPSPGMRSPPAPHPPPGQAAAEGPVTHEELQRLTQMAQSRPTDTRLQLTLAKKLVEAVTVLADEGGRADTKTRNRNRERYSSDAHKIIKRLVAANDTEAMFYLADCHGRGLLGLQPDLKEAFNLYQSAAKLGHAQAAYRVAVCCELGQEDGGGTRRDPLKAMQWYKRAATLGDTPAMYKMGMIQLKGLLGQTKQPRDAVVWLKRAAEQADEENPHALHELGLLFENAGESDSIIRDEVYSRQLFHQAANLGYKFSQFRLGCAYEYGLMGLPIDPRQSIAWYSKAAVQEEHQSELALSGWYLTGAEGVLQQNDTEAYLWARKAAQAELAKAQYAMGYFTEVGIGAPANLEDAKRWYWRAASQNFPKARDRLEDLKKGGARMQKARVSRSAMHKSDGECLVM